MKLQHGNFLAERLPEEKHDPTDADVGGTRPVGVGAGAGGAAPAAERRPGGREEGAAARGDRERSDMSTHSSLASGSLHRNATMLTAESTLHEESDSEVRPPLLKS